MMRVDRRLPPGLGYNGCAALSAHDDKKLLRVNRVLCACSMFGEAAEIRKCSEFRAGKELHKIYRVIPAKF